ncbi:hypothetical protein AHAS_Ahas19G0257100 [Arachis hypogaea]
MITVNLSTYFLQIISMMMVGHLGKLALSSTAIATSLCAVSGFKWLSLWSKAIYKIWCSNLHLYCSFESSLYFSLSFMDMLGENNGFVWSRPFDFIRSKLEDLLCALFIPALFAYVTLHTLIRYFLVLPPRNQQIKMSCSFSNVYRLPIRYYSMQISTLNFQEQYHE